MKNYFLEYDGFGQWFLWEGPIEDGSNFHYAKFYGHTEDGKDIWVMERSDKPERCVPVFGIGSRLLAAAQPCVEPTGATSAAPKPE